MRIAPLWQADYLPLACLPSIALLLLWNDPALTMSERISRARR
jgi:hypothetical protein